MAYLELAEGKRKTTRIPAYYRNGHSTRGHVRHLNDDDIFYIRVPDPENKLKPVLVREDFFDLYGDDDFSKLIRFVTPFNDKKYLSQISVRRMNRVNVHHLNEQDLLSDIFGDVLDVVKIGAGFIPGVGTLVSTGISALQGVTSTGDPTNKPVVTYDDSNLHIIGPSIYIPPVPVEYAYKGPLTNRPGVTTYARPTGNDVLNIPNDFPLLPANLPNRPGAFTKILDSKVFGIPSVIAYPVAAFAAYKFLSK